MNRPLALFLSAISALASSLEWPEFRGPTGQGISTATNLPVKWSAAENVRWKTPLEEGWSSPVISQGKIYLTGATNVGNGISLRAICLNFESGEVIWNVETLHAPAAGQKHRKNSLASPTPIVRDGKVYVHFGHLGTAALDLTGKVLWRQSSISYTPVHGNGGSPALVGELLIFSCDAARDPFLVALDVADGSIKWRTPRNSPARNQFSFSTPLLVKIDGVEQLISPASGFVGAYDSRTGKELWRAGYGEGYSVIPRPVYAHDLLFVSSGFDRPVIYALNPLSAKGDVTDSAVIWNQAKGAPCTPSLLAVGEELYSVSDSGIASCFDATSGKTHWSERLGGGFSASPVCAEGKIYFQNEEGVGFVVKAAKTYELLAKNELGDRTLASVAAVDNALLIRSAEFLWRIGK